MRMCVEFQDEILLTGEGGSRFLRKGRTVKFGQNSEFF